jgi:hypothetical protein
MAKSKTSKKYTREFQQELVALQRAGRSISELSREFGPTRVRRQIVMPVVGGGVNPCNSGGERAGYRPDAMSTSSRCGGVPKLKRNW